MNAAQQIPLGVGLRDEASFGNYFPGPNGEVLQAVQTLVSGAHQFLYLWGAAGTGKTHLLHAACHGCAIQDQRSAYLPLKDLRTLQPELLEGLEQLALVCVDDVQAVAGQGEWETALFHLYNRLRASGARLLISGVAPPPAAGIQLADLGSRLGWGLVLHLRSLDDVSKISALQLRARNRGMDLPAEVGEYLLRHWPRDMARLYDLLQRLDMHSLTQQRKLTIPFVRTLITHATAETQ
ncbi:MAG: DnaA regulatory inactivator Hda [Gammaproteobacteria bacterium]|nr:DnaA regulatory inactivator Hda [Gammaproteobacteria bacterium]